MQIINIKDAEGKKINGYKIRSDEKGEYVKRFKMRGALVKSSTFTASGKTEFVEYKVTSYTAL